MIGQMNFDGRDKVEQAILRIKTFEPEEGYYLAFSGGKDSVVVKALCDMAGVKYDAHYNVTSVDPPEMVQFVKTFPDVQRDIPHDKDGNPVTMWNLIVRMKGPPSRIQRYCCVHLKEGTGTGRFVITGVRKAESVRRAKNRAGLELGNTRTGRRERLDPDNASQNLIDTCPTKAQRVLNPIIDWEDEDVWGFIRQNKIPYCKLYDEGLKRLGCIGCPMAGSKGQKREFERWPKYYDMYLRAFDRVAKELVDSGAIDRLKDGDVRKKWRTGQAIMDWWLNWDERYSHKG